MLIIRVLGKMGFDCDRAFAKNRFGVPLVFGIWLIIFFPYVFQKMAVGWDAADFFFPDAWFLSYNLHHSTMPLFNPYILCGYPKIGDPQSMYLLPTQIFFCRLFYIDTLSKFTLLILFYLACGGAYLFALLRRQGQALAPALIGVLAFMLGGPVMTRMQHSSMVVAYSFIPAVLFHYYAALHAPRRAILHYLAGSFFFYCLLVNMNHVAYLASMVIGLFCVFEIWNAGERRRANTIRMALAWLLTGLVTAVALIPVFLLTGEGTRENFNYASLNGGLDPFNLITWLIPNFFGTIHGLVTAQTTGSASLSGTMMALDTSVWYLYLGTVPILLIVVALLAYRKDRRFLFVTGLLAIAFIYSFGENTDLYKPIFEYLPGAKKFRRAADAAFILNLLMSLLAAMSAQLIFEKRRLEKINRKSIVALVFMAGLALLSICLRQRFLIGYKHIVNQVFLHGIFISALVLLLTSRHLEKRWVWALLVLVTAADLRYNNVANLMNGHKDIQMPALEMASQFLRQQVEQNHDRVEYFQVWGVGSTRESVGWGVEQIGGYDPLNLQLYKQHASADRQSDPTKPLLLRNPAMAASLGVRYLASVTELPCKNLFFKKVGSIFIYKNDPVKPRLMYVENGQEKSAMAGSTFHVNTFSAHPKGRIQGKVVAHYFFSKGWVAKVDGKPRPVQAYQGRFLSVDVAAGEKRVTFEYNPWRYVLSQF